MALCQDEAEPEDISSCPEIIQGYTLLSPGRGDRESHSWHSICQEIRLALPSKYLQKFTLSDPSLAPA